MSVYRVIDVIGTSSTSWEEAANEAITTAATSLRDLRVAEVLQQDIALGEDGKLEAFRTKLRVSFKYEAPVGKLQRAGEEFGFAAEPAE